jgi:anti-sigma regulatory factor (Ser/Thr protein kinase)
LRLVFGDGTCLPLIRRWLRSNLANEDLELDAELVCCELVTNAVEHGGGAGTVRVEVMPGGQVRVEVDDGDAAGVLTVGRSRLDACRGRGLMIVRSVARWGIRRTVTGKTVWATLGPTASRCDVPGLGA